MKTFKRVLNILGTILLVFLIAVVIIMFNSRISGEAPSVFGYHVFRVSSPSMEPELVVGDVIIVKEVEPQDIRKGDTVTYLGIQGDMRDKYITHKVVEDPIYEDGEYTFVTQGVAEGTVADPQWSEDRLVGVFKLKVPFIDKIYSFFLKPYGLVSFVLVIMLLFGYELISLIVSYNTLDQPDEDDDSSSDETDGSTNNSNLE